MVQSTPTSPQTLSQSRQNTPVPNPQADDPDQDADAPKLGFSKLQPPQNLLAFLLMFFIQQSDDPAADEEAEKDPNSKKSQLNKTFEDILGMDDKSFKSWRQDMRDTGWQDWKKVTDFSKTNFTKAESFVKTPPKSLLDLVSRHEAKSYDTVYGGKETITYNAQQTKLTDLTLNQVLDWQAQQHRAGVPSTAAGKYQFMEDTLKGLKNDPNNHLTGNEKFTPELQDKLATALMQRRGLQKFLDGESSSAAFLHELSKEWASLPDPNKDGQSFYSGAKGNAGKLNKSFGSVATDTAALDQLREAAKAAPTGSTSDLGTAYQIAAMNLPKKPAVGEVTQQKPGSTSAPTVA